jgi:hypothetical protein
MPKANQIFNREIILRSLTRDGRGKPTTTVVHLLVATTAVSCVLTQDQPDFIPTSNNGFFQ